MFADIYSQRLLADVISFVVTEVRLYFIQLSGLDDLVE